MLLLVLVPVLSTLAKNSLYFPTSNPAHYVSISNKMKVSHAVTIPDSQPLRPVAAIAPVQPPVVLPMETCPDRSPAAQIGISLSPRHRAPPALLS